MDSKEIINILERTGALITGSHFVLVSGKHTDAYVNKDKLYPHTGEVSLVGRMIAEKHKDVDIDVVVGPALGGIILSQWTAHHLSKLTGKNILAVYTEKTPDNNQIFTRGYDALIPGKNILVVEDTTTTGMSAKKSLMSVKNAGGNVVAVSVIVNRNPKEVNSEFMGAPFNALVELKMETYEETDCPLCKNNIPINMTVGHGKKFMEKHGRQ
ncbi:MAG: orotate phosphoribosyltransferase [Candidatus Liptonbacteria bacterium]|nr:orotate phosphoribosyltransferase [Candidatus Liptonbacteria bacterium]